ncbi:MAG TPA: hypothetical protein DCL61_27135 [Cyanobacteria bacterium UBA12227]|nr:hypothetical protein [Cyanobacteria bacterium UBA12227]HAX88784.1 hypothetical protein [Cyanobacteria bacterium UBA11370]HBY79687.1 hypothetical protein [Cyanobacteria bacterium UBA11148]
MPRISCIIVSYNNGRFLKNAVMSVINQTMPVAEIIMADDGSTDGSRELITSLAQQYSQIKPIFREKNLGVATNRDLAIREANSDLITTLDGDDWYSPEKIEREFLAIQNYSVAIAYSDIQQVYSDSKKICCWNISEFSSLDRKQRLRWLAHLLGYIPRDMLIPKKLYLEAGGMQHNLALYEDWDLQIRLAAYPNPWMHSGIVGINYRRTDSGLSQSNSVLRHTQCQYQILMSNHQLLKEHIGEYEFWFAIAKVFIREGRAALSLRSKLRNMIKKLPLSF